jgi:hypothetical protein
MSRSARMPPVPPASRSRKGPGAVSEPVSDTSKRKQPPENLAEQGRQGNIRQNTQHQGYQQDR